VIVVDALASVDGAIYAFVVAPEEWLTTGQAAELLGVHRSTLLRYVEEGRLPARRLPTGHYRVRREDLEKLLEQGEQPEDKPGSC
jgi:excisionase family DNA binding protein